MDIVDYKAHIMKANLLSILIYEIFIRRKLDLIDKNESISQGGEPLRKCLMEGKNLELNSRFKLLFYLIREIEMLISFVLSF